jgi:hypothetical protein
MKGVMQRLKSKGIPRASGAWASRIGRALYADETASVL